jgi:hypothetical protein
MNQEDQVRRIQDSFRNIPTLATSLNNVSDSLNNSARRIEAVLKKHALGVTSWVKFPDKSPRDGMTYHYEQVGFTKINGRWSLAIRTVDGDEVNGDKNVETWPFNEAPRGLRVKAVNSLPELVVQLEKDGNEMIQEVTEQVKAVDLLADALEAVLVPTAESHPDKPSARLPLRPLTSEKSGPRN